MAAASTHETVAAIYAEGRALKGRSFRLAEDTHEDVEPHEDCHLFPAGTLVRVSGASVVDCPDGSFYGVASFTEACRVRPGLVSFDISLHKWVRIEDIRRAQEVTLDRCGDYYKVPAA